MEPAVRLSIKDYFRDGLLPQLRGNFPYPERFCPYCERELTLIEAIHIQDHLEHYKALYLCLNTECGAYDEAAGQAYARVYYSSNEAYNGLETARIAVSDLPKIR
jgi:hypothetical protein